MIEERLAALGIELPPVFPPAGSYVGCVVVGDTVFVGSSPRCTPSSATSIASSGSSRCSGWSTAHPASTKTPQVIDGCSDVLVEIFGDAGRHTRSAVGMAELPFDIAVEIELTATLKR